MDINFKTATLFGSSNPNQTVQTADAPKRTPSMIDKYVDEIKLRKSQNRDVTNQNATPVIGKQPARPIAKNKIYHIGNLKDGVRQVDADSVYEFYIRSPFKIPCDYAMANKTLDKTNSTTNGEINEFMQGLRGDCYLLASLYAIRSTKEGSNILKKNIEYNSDGSITVTLPGAIKARENYMAKGEKEKCFITGKYHITKEALKKAQSLSGKSYAYGDLDVTIMELAYEAYNAEVHVTNCAMGQTKEPYIPGQMCGGSRLDALSMGQMYDAIYILTGKQSEMYSTSMSNYNKLKLYCRGDYSVKKVSGIKYNKVAGIKAYKPEKEVTNVYNKASDLQKMLDKYKGQEDKYAITVGFICGIKMPNGEIRKGGGHALSVTKITDKYVEVANPYDTAERERIPRADFEKMASKLVVSEMN